MAEEKKPVKRRIRSFLFFLWIVVYAGLRIYGDIINQVARTEDGRVLSEEAVVGTEPTLPRWKRQVYRVVFSPLMVAEEEIRRQLAQRM